MITEYINIKNNMSEIKVHRINPFETIMILNFFKNNVAAWFLRWQRKVNGNKVLFLEERPKNEKRERALDVPKGALCKSDLKP